MKTWTKSRACKSHAHCLACRNDAAFRLSIFKNGMAETPIFACPEGADIGQTENLPKQRGLGDIIEGIAKPTAKALGLPCLDENDKLKPESGCAKRRDRLNKLTIPA